MIIETPYKQHDTVTVRTNGGEELICRFIQEDDKTITIEKPLAVMVTQQGLGLGPFCFTVAPDKKLKLNKDLILFIHKTDEEFSKQYIQSTTGIAI